MVNRFCCFVLVSFFHPYVSFQPDQVHNCSSLCGHIKIYTGIYQRMVWGRNKLLGEVRTAGSLGCFFLAAMVVHAVKCLSDYRFTTKDCEESDSAAGENADSEQSKHRLWQFFSSLALLKQKVSQYACDSENLFVCKSIKNRIGLDMVHGWKM